MSQQRKQIGRTYKTVYHQSWISVLVSVIWFVTLTVTLITCCMYISDRTSKRNVNMEVKAEQSGAERRMLFFLIFTLFVDHVYCNVCCLINTSCNCISAEFEIEFPSVCPSVMHMSCE